MRRRTGVHRSLGAGLAAGALLLASSFELQAQVVTFSVSGSTPASIQPTVDSFRTALGALNPNVAGSAASGRREINWDGVPDAFSAPNALPGNFFNVNSARGVEISTPGSSLQTSATASSGTPIRFGNINATYSTHFQTFSAQRLFTAIGSNIIDINFFVPGSTTPATVSGFGAVFTDVESAGSTRITLFLANGTIGGSFDVPTSTSAGLSFLGLTHTSRISRVRIQSGNAALGGSDNPGGGADLAVMDDFIYGEPQAKGTLDVDASVTASKYDALTDGLLVIRYLFGLTGTTLTSGAIGGTATRTDPAAIKTYLDGMRAVLDVDGNGNADALTDGLLILRYLFGLRGAALINGAFDPLGARTTAPDIQTYLQTLTP